MSTICGRYVRTFAEADTAMLDNVSLNAPYPFFWLKIDRVQGGVITCSAAGEIHCLKIRRTALGEQSLISMLDPVFGQVRYPVLPLLSEGGTPIDGSQFALALAR